METEILAVADETPMRVMVVEAEAMARLGLRHCLGAAPNLRICAEAETVVAAYASWVQQRPEVAVIDPDLDGGGGWKLLHALTHARPPVECLVWLREERASAVSAALRAGARAVSLRTEGADELLHGLLMTALGLRHLSVRTMRMLGDGIAMGAPNPTHEMPRLPERQAQVFRLLGQGFTPREIAVKLGISLKTVQTHVGRMKTQLGARCQAELCRRALLARSADGVGLEPAATC